MPYKDGAPTLGEQLEADEARKFYTDEILAEAQDLMRDNKRLRAEVERLKDWQRRAVDELRIASSYPPVSSDELEKLISEAQEADDG